MSVSFSVFLLFPMLCLPSLKLCLLVCFGVTLMLGALFKCKMTLIFLLIIQRKHFKKERERLKSQLENQRVHEGRGAWRVSLWVSSMDWVPG